MSELIFKEIRAIEEEAAKITLNAEKQAAEILKKANDGSIQLRAGKDSELTNRKESELKKAIRAGAELKQKRIDEAAASIEGLKTKVEMKSEKAIKLVLNRLSQRIGERSV